MTAAFRRGSSYLSSNVLPWRSIRLAFVLVLALGFSWVDAEKIWGNKSLRYVRLKVSNHLQYRRADPLSETDRMITRRRAGVATHTKSKRNQHKGSTPLTSSVAPSPKPRSVPSQRALPRLTQQTTALQVQAHGQQAQTPPNNGQGPQQVQNVPVSGPPPTLSPVVSSSPPSDTPSSVFVPMTLSPSPSSTYESTGLPTMTSWDSVENLPVIQLTLSIWQPQHQNVEQQTVDNGNLEQAVLAGILHLMCRQDDVLMAVQELTPEADVEGSCLASFKDSVFWSQSGRPVLKNDPTVQTILVNSSNIESLFGSTGYALSTWTVLYQVLTLGVALENEFIQNSPHSKIGNVQAAGLNLLQQNIQLDMNDSMMAGSFDTFINAVMGSNRTIFSSPVGKELQILAQKLPFAQQSAVTTPPPSPPAPTTTGSNNAPGWVYFLGLGIVFLFASTIAFCIISYFLWTRQKQPIKEAKAGPNCGGTIQSDMPKAMHPESVSAFDDPNYAAGLQLVMNLSLDDSIMTGGTSIFGGGAKYPTKEFQQDDLYLSELSFA